MSDLQLLIESETIRRICGYYAVDWSKVSRHNPNNGRYEAIYIRSVCEYCLHQTGEMTNKLIGQITGVNRNAVKNDIERISADISSGAENGLIAGKIITRVTDELQKIITDYKRNIALIEVKKYRTLLRDAEKRYMKQFGEVPV